MIASQRLQIEQSEVRQRINAALGKDELSDEERTALDSDTKRAQQVEVELRAALVVEGTEERAALESEPDAEMRERLELRSRATLTGYIMAALQGREVTGAEAELRAAANSTGIPLELFDVPETRADVATGSPSTGTGVNVDPVLPMIYARSIASRIGIAMPRVSSGTFSQMTITAGLTAGATAAGTARESTAATLTPKTTTPHRISARLSIRVEDVATVGVGNFESSLRQNLMLALSDQLDKYSLNGDGTSPNPQGILPQLTAATDPTAVTDWADFVEASAAGIDGGPWAETLMEVRTVVNPAVMRLAERTFQSATNYAGEVSAASYLRANSGGFWANSRMPIADTSTHIAGGLIYRPGTMGLEGVNAMRTAVCPIWNEVSIDDIYSDSAAGTRHFTLHTLIGDVLITQSDAYRQVKHQVA